MKRVDPRYALYASAVGAGVLLMAVIVGHNRHRHYTESAAAEPLAVAVTRADWILLPSGAGDRTAGAAHALDLARRTASSADAETDDSFRAVSAIVDPSSADPVASGRGTGRRRLDTAAVIHIADRCAPTAPASVLASIVQVESGGDPLRIGVNGPRHQVYTAASNADAVALARQLLDRGHNIDLGLAQINNRNLAGLGLTLDDVFDPCDNLAAAATMINRGYAAALRAGEPNRPILQMAYSIYNSGDQLRGIANGYAAKVEAAQSVGR